VSVLLRVSNIGQLSVTIRSMSFL